MNLQLLIQAETYQPTWNIFLLSATEPWHSCACRSSLMSLSDAVDKTAKKAAMRKLNTEECYRFNWWEKDSERTGAAGFVSFYSCEQELCVLWRNQDRKAFKPRASKGLKCCGLRDQLLNRTKPQRLGIGYLKFLAAAENGGPDLSLKDLEYMQKSCPEYIIGQTPPIDSAHTFRIEYVNTYPLAFPLIRIIWLISLASCLRTKTDTPGKMPECFWPQKPTHTFRLSAWPSRRRYYDNGLSVRYVAISEAQHDKNQEARFPSSTSVDSRERWAIEG